MDAVAKLTQLFVSRPVWHSAAQYLEDGATSDVYFTNRPGEAWHLERRSGRAELLPGSSPAPDFVFRFPHGAVERLEAADGSVGDVAVALLRLIVEADPELRVEVRIVASFPALMRRGYLSLLAAGGLRVLAFGAAHGIRTLRDLRALLERVRTSRPAHWEVARPSPLAAGPDPAQPGLRLRLRRASREIGLQHERLREIRAGLDEALAQDDRRRLRERMAQYRDALLAHFSLEDEVFFPALHGLYPERYSELEALSQDHDALTLSVVSLSEGVSHARASQWQAEFYELRRALALHEGREEALVRELARGANDG